MVFGYMEIDGIVGPVSLFSKEAKQKYRQQAIDNALKRENEIRGGNMKIRYSRLWSFGNFENEKVELEQDFPNTMSYAEGLSMLMLIVNRDHNIRVKIREVVTETDQLERSIANLRKGDVYYGAQLNPEQVNEQIIATAKQLAQCKRQLKKLNRQLLEV